MTLPAVTGLLDCLATAPPVRAAPRVRPAPVLAAVAADPAWPRTVASAIGGEPLETTRLTAEPLATLVPAVGLSLMPLPAATVLLDCCVTAPTMRPAPVMALVAAACIWPTTFGTSTGGGGGDPICTTAWAWAITTPEGAAGSEERRAGTEGSARMA